MQHINSRLEQAAGGTRSRTQSLVPPAPGTSGIRTPRTPGTPRGLGPGGGVLGMSIVRLLNSPISPIGYSVDVPSLIFRKISKRTNSKKRARAFRTRMPCGQRPSELGMAGRRWSRFRTPLTILKRLVQSPVLRYYSLQFITV